MRPRRSKGVLETPIRAGSFFQIHYFLFCDQQLAMSERGEEKVGFARLLRG